jgi:hypothetical protein
MRKLLFFLTTFFIIFNCFAAPVLAPGGPPKLNANEVFIPVGKSGQQVSLMELSTMKFDELQKLTGKKMNLFERIMLKKGQKKLQSSIAADGTINSKKLNKAFSGDVTSGFHLGGFALGLFLLLLGVLIAYLINDANHSVRVKWAWIGAAIGLLLWIIISVL